MDVEPTIIQPILEEAVKEFRRRATTEIHQILNQQRVEMESHREKKRQRKMKEGRTALAQVLESTSVAVNSEFFLSSIIRIRIEDQVFNVHSAVVQKLPYFATLGSGRWGEADIFDLTLPVPCVSDDFLVLIQHMYQAQEIPFVFEDLGSALRAALVGSMLLVDDQTLAGIATAISHTVRTKEDVIALRTFLIDHQLPAIFDRISNPETVFMPVDDFKQMVASAAIGHCEEQRDVAEAIIAVHVGGNMEHKKALSEAVARDAFCALSTGGGCRCHLSKANRMWWLDMVMKYASADQVLTVLRNISQFLDDVRQCCPDCRWVAEWVPLLQKSFFEYVRATQTLDIAFVGICSQQCVLSFGHKPEGLQVLSEVLRRPGSSIIMKKMATCSAAAMVGLLDEQVLQAVPDQKQLIANLCKDKKSVLTWASSERLNALSFENRWAVCSALASQISQLNSAVLQVVRDTL